MFKPHGAAAMTCAGFARLAGLRTIPYVRFLDRSAQ